MQLKKLYQNPSSEDLLHYGHIVKLNNFSTRRGYYTIRIIKYDGAIYFHKMRNGHTTEIINLT